ncbi:vWA domain-containing protein [Intestinibacter sp.]
MKIKKTIITLLIILVSICCLGAGCFVLLSNKNDTMRNYNNKYQEYAKQKDELILSNYINDENSANISEYNELSQNYNFALLDLNDALKSKDIEKCKKADSELSSLGKNLKNKDESILNDKSNEIENEKKENTFEFSVSGGTNNTSINDDIEKFNNLFKDSKYNSAYKKYIKIKNKIDNLSTSVAGLPILRYDYDYSEKSPKVRLYIDTDEFQQQLKTDSLDLNKFRIYEFSDGALNELDGIYKKADAGNLSVDLVADVSGSMEDKLFEVKNSTETFAKKLTEQNNAVGLISFSDDSKREMLFTKNASEITTKINDLYTRNMTALYDTLYESLTTISTQNTAKCILVFTDGADNYSNYSKDYIKEYAKQLNIPIYIIGLGNELGYFENDLRDIANYTGGLYYPPGQSTLDDIYDDILKNQGNLGYVEFTDKTPNNSDRKLYIQYDNGPYYKEFSSDLKQVYKNGEQAQKEAINNKVINFIDSTNNLYFDVIQKSTFNDDNSKKLKSNYEDNAHDNANANLVKIIDSITNKPINERSTFYVYPIVVENIKTDKDKDGNNVYIIKYHQYYRQYKPKYYKNQEWKLSDGEIFGVSEEYRDYKGTEIETVVEKNSKFYIRYVDSSKTPENINMPPAYKSK